MEPPQIEDAPWGHQDSEQTPKLEEGGEPTLLEEGESTSEARQDADVGGDDGEGDHVDQVEEQSKVGSKGEGASGGALKVADRDAVEEEEEGGAGEPEEKRPKCEPADFAFLRSSSSSFHPLLLSSASACFRPHYEDSVAYTRGCKFSPDGLCVLAAASDDALRIFETPSDPGASSSSSLHPCVTMKEGETVYDFCWYPRMDSSRPETCCLAATSQYHPVHLYDAYHGGVRATYRCFNHLDELVAANSLAFSADGARLYVGLHNEIRIFDVSLPGRECLEARKTWTKQEGGQPGIVSCIAPNPFLHNVYALASYRKTVGVYLEPRAHLLCLLEGQAGGVTHAQFTADGSKLLVGGRKDPEVLIWDMRNPGRLFAVLRRPVDTNQRVYFDVHPENCRWVVGGSTDGTVRIWDISQPPSSGSDSCSGAAKEEGEGRNDDAPVIDPVWSSSEMHSDCVNGASFHPTEQLVVTCSGQRHVSRLLSKDSEEEDSEEEADSSEEDGGKRRRRRTVPECSLKLWSFKEP